MPTVLDFMDVFAAAELNLILRLWGSVATLFYKLPGLLLLRTLDLQRELNVSFLIWSCEEKS